MSEMRDEIDFPALQGALAGTWSIEREIGRGGMGVVYLARDVSLDRPVAIKVLHPRLARRAEARDRFLAEARTGGRLSHPNIVPIYAVGETGDLVYFVMGLIDGESLGASIRREGPLAAAQATKVIREIGWALAHAHAMGVLHRDVTLDNVLVERQTGRAVLVDFGIAAEVERADATSLVGTPAYIAPELIHGAPPSVQSDLYALAIMSWATLTGRLPFDGPDSAATLMLHVTADIPSLASAAPATPSRIVGAIERSLSKDPAARPTDTEEFVTALDESSAAVTIPPALLRWVTRGERIRPAWAFAAPLAGMLTLVSMRKAGLYGGILESALPIVLVLGATGILHIGFALSELRRVLRAGYGNNDLALALKQQRVSTAPKPAPLLGRVIHDLGSLAVIGLVIGMIAPKMLNAIRTDEAWRMVSVVFELVGWCWMILWTAIGAEFVLQCHPIVRRLQPGRGERFWASQLGRAAGRIVGIGLPTIAEAGHTLHRPTELMLNLAIEDLWNALPDAHRKAMQDAPGIASGLRRRVAELKEALRVIDNSAGRQPIAELTAIRQRLAERHEAGVTALERIRLLLIKLGGAASSPGEFTAQLEDARAVERSLLEELGAHPSLRKQLKSGMRNASPAPTPVG